MKSTTTPAVLFVGLSAKPATSALCHGTNTGNVISAIESAIQPLRTLRTNLVREPPLNQCGKLRYPNAEEKSAGLQALFGEIGTLRPAVVVALGVEVSRVILRGMCGDQSFSGFGNSYDYSVAAVGRIRVIPVHHPSFVCIYRRKTLDSYTKAVADVVMASVTTVPTVRRYNPIYIIDPACVRRRKISQIAG